MRKILRAFLTYGALIAIAGAFVASLFICGCATKATRTVRTLPNGEVQTTMEINRLDSEAKIGGDSIKAGNVSVLDRIAELDLNDPNGLLDEL